MAASGQVVSIGTTATLVFQFIDGYTYVQNGYTAAANPNIFKCGTGTDPVPLLVVLPATGTVYFGGSAVTSSGANIGVALTAAQVPSFMYNNIGGDSLYAVVASGTANISLLALRQ